MEGTFVRKKYNIWFFACGLGFVGLYIFLNTVDPSATSDSVIFLIIGILIIAVVFIVHISVVIRKKKKAKKA